MSTKNWKGSFSLTVLALVLGVGVLGAVGAVQAAVLNVNFNNGGNNYTGQGALSDPGHNSWNNVSGGSGTYGALTYSDGITPATGVSFTTTNANLYSIGATIGLYKGDINNANVVGTLTVNGLTAGANYDVYLYSGGDAGWSSSFTISALTKGPLVTTNTSSFVEDDNYLKFTNQTATGGSLAISMTSPAGKYWVLNGFQVAPASISEPADIPEPATMVLLGAGVAALMRHARRRIAA